MQAVRSGKKSELIRKLSKKGVKTLEKGRTAAAEAIEKILGKSTDFHAKDVLLSFGLRINYKTVPNGDCFFDGIFNGLRSVNYTEHYFGNLLDIRRGLVLFIKPRMIDERSDMVRSDLQ